MSEASVETAIADVIWKKSANRLAQGVVDLDAPLADFGLDSLDVAGLMIDIESAFPTVTIKDDDFDRRSTGRQIAALIASRVGEAP